jgi:hypothetical protein
VHFCLKYSSILLINLSEINILDALQGNIHKAFSQAIKHKYYQTLQTKKPPLGRFLAAHLMDDCK